MIQIPDPRTSGTAMMRVYSILEIFHRDEEKAFDYMKHLRANVKVYPSSGNPRPVAYGDAGVGISMLTHALYYIQQGADVVISFPKEGIAMDCNTVSLIKGAPHPEAAKKLIDWATSPAAQNLYPTYKINVLPAHPEAELAPSLVEAVKGATLFPFDNAFISEHWERIVERWEKEVLP
jgi:iron(III) transport system substrate-binding protein